MGSVKNALPEIAKNVAEPLSKVDKITMYGEGNSAKLLGDIINGTTPHSLLLELLTDAGVGTVIHSTETAYEFDTHPHPLSTFAARLTENLDEVEKLQTV